MRHDHNLVVCKRCGETDRALLLRSRCFAPMSRAAKRLWLRRSNRPDVLFQLMVCAVCDEGFFRLTVDTRRLCYAC